MSDATIHVVNNTGIDPRISAADHARQQADVLASDLSRQETRAARVTEQLQAALVAARTAWITADNEARRLEAIVREI